MPLKRKIDDSKPQKESPQIDELPSIFLENEYQASINSSLITVSQSSDLDHDEIAKKIEMKRK